MNRLCSKNRPLIIDELKKENFDLCIIGGGITGAGIALDATSRGMKVALIEMNDFASGTSSKSTKLIHGGLRYLKQLELKLVREVGRERAVLHRLAPHLVVPEKMLLPITKKGTYSKWSTSIGLWLYDFIAGIEGNDRRKMLSAKDTLAEEPLLNKKGLIGGGLYAEYRTDDARLTIENIKTAVRHGAICLNYIKAINFTYQNKTISGVCCTDVHLGESFSIKAKYVVNATGPWVDKLMDMNHSLKEKHLALSKGVHLVIPHKRLPIKHAIYFDVPDGRMMFAIPRQQITYLGTTDTLYKKSPELISVTDCDINYIIDSVNLAFFGINLTKNDIISAWAGLRPLIYEEGKSVAELSRKDEVFESETGLLSIAGGKLTGYRKMAERIVDKIDKKHKIDYKKLFLPCNTKNIYLTKNPLLDIKSLNNYKENISKRVLQLSLPSFYTDYLVHNYGTQVDSILAYLPSANNTSPEEALILSELHYCLDNELVLNALDFFYRRTGRLYFNVNSVNESGKAVLVFLKKYFDWNAETYRAAEITLRDRLQSKVF